MDFLPDGAHVRLQSLVRGTFLHADEDGRGVSLTGRRETISTAWQAHRVTGEDGNPYVLLLCSAYGRYLAVSPAASPHGHRDRRAFQNAYNDPHQPDIIWEGVAVGDHVFLMRHGSGCLLRANGDEQRWVNGLSVDDASNQSTMTHWKVEAIPPRALAPALPLPTPQSHGTLLRAIVYVRANNLEDLELNERKDLLFPGRSVFNLRSAIALELKVAYLTITLCIRAGNLGRFVPLTTNLPHDRAPLFIGVLSTGSPAAMRLVHPHVGSRRSRFTPI